MNSQNKLINDILLTYSAILENKRIVEATDVYDNINFNNTVIKDANPINDNINVALLQDIETAAKAAGVKVDITTAVSGHKEETESGNISRHVPGNAVDIAIVNGVSVRDSTIKSDVLKFVDELVKMGYVKNEAEIESRPKVVLTYGFKNHDGHVHISNTTSTPSTATNSSSNSNYSSGKLEYDPLIGAIGDTIGNIVKKGLGMTEHKKIQENIKRIKGLL